MKHTIAVLSAVLMPFTSHAAILTWDAGGVNDNWTTGDNWNTNNAPVTGDTANLTNATVGAQTVTYNSEVYPTGARLGTLNVSNAGGGTTTLNVSSNFYITTAANINGGGAVSVSSGLLDLGAGSLFTVGASGTTGSLNVNGTGAFGSGGARLIVGSGSANSGSVTYSSSSNTTALRQIKLDNGSITFNSASSGALFGAAHSGIFGGANAIIDIGSGGAGTSAVFNMSSAGTLFASSAGTTRVLNVGVNGTVNWSNGNLLSNVTTSPAVNSGIWNYTRASGQSNLTLASFTNNGTFNWTGGGTMNLGSLGTPGTGDFINQAGGIINLQNDGQVTLRADLVLNADGSLFVGLGTATTTGLLSTGNGTFKLTLGGHLDFTELAGFQYNTNYTILSGGGLGTITGSFASFDSSIVVIDNGLTSGNYIIQIVPEPSTFALLAVGLTVVMSLRRRRAMV